MKLCKGLAKSWNEADIIFSPRDLNPDQIIKFSGELKKLSNISISIDPQLYSPTTDHERLNAHDFFPSSINTGELWGKKSQTKLLKKIVEANRTIGTNHTIAPSPFFSAPTDQWLEIQKSILGELHGLDTTATITATLPLGSGVIKNDSMIGKIIEDIESWPASTIYMVCEHPAEAYFVSDQQWLDNLYDLVAGIRLAGKRVLFGYGNQQQLGLACAGCNSIASGNFMNTRSFSTLKFEKPDAKKIRRKSTWYYSHRSLSEYKLPTLDNAKNKSLLQLLKPKSTFDSGYAKPLFSAGQPSSSGFAETASFNHYLATMRKQALKSQSQSFDDTVDAALKDLDNALALLTKLRKSRIFDDARDFAPALAASRKAIETLKTNRGPVLRRKWNSL